jgi:hypothetical protein
MNGPQDESLSRIFFCPLRYVLLHYSAFFCKTMEATQQLAQALQRLLTPQQHLQPQEIDLAARKAAAEGSRLAEIANRIYHMGTKPTPGLDYDDRLTTRLGCSSSTAYIYLALAEHRGGIRHRRLGKKYHVTERAVRDWEGDSKALAA